jgi:hypothetical protein
MLATSRRKMRSDGPSDPPRNQGPGAIQTGEFCWGELTEGERPRSVACGEHAPDVDQIIRDDAQADPPVHAGVPFIATAI